MLSIEKQNLISELKKTRQVKAEQGFKISLYERLAEIDSDFLAKLAPLEAGLPTGFAGARLFYRAPVFAPSLLLAAVIVLAGSGTGITLAAQSALPGDILYPIKIVSEKARVAIVSDNNKKAQLHFEFSSRRLNEVAELAKDSASDQKLTEIAVENYKKELNKGHVVLFFKKSEEEVEKAADLLADITSKNKESIAKIGIEAKNHKIADSLRSAWEDTIEHNDRAVLIILKNDIPQATSSSAFNSARGKRVVNKIAEVERKILETERYLLRQKEGGIDASEAEAKINGAKELISETEELLTQTKYENAFNKVMDAQKTVISAQKIVEYKNGDNDEDKLEMFKYYYSPNSATSSENFHNLNSTTSAIFNQPASLIEQINKVEKDNSDGDKNDVKKGNNWQEKKRKKTGD